MVMQVDSLDFIVAGSDPSLWPNLAAPAAGELHLVRGKLRLEANREVLFLGAGQIRAGDDTHRLSFDVAGNALDLHEQGTIRLLTGGPPPVERLRVQPDGKIGIGTATPGAALEVAGTIKATSYLLGNTPLVSSQWTTQGANLSFTGGNVGIGTAAPAHPLDVHGAVNATSYLVNGAPLASSQWVSQGADLSFTGGSVGIGTTSPADSLDVISNIRILTGFNPLRFTSGWTGFPDAVTNQAEISNDTGDYKTLMIVGNRSAGLGRRVSVWDRLEVNGNQSVSGSLSFGALTRQMINLWGTEYGIGVQSGTQYYRSGGDFAWHKGGSHSDAWGNPGGGVRLMALNAFGDLILSARTNPAADPNKSFCRALVDAGNQLVINYGNDYSNGTRVSSTLFVDGNAFKPGGGSWANSSDRSLKKNINPLGGTLDRLLQLRGVSFEWKEPEKQGNLTGNQVGLVAQEVEEVFPEWVGVAPDGLKYVAIRGFEALTIEAFRELKAGLDALRASIGQLETRVSALDGGGPQ